MDQIDIKSRIHDYRVNFIDNFRESLGSVLEDGDTVIIDKSITELYGQDVNSILNGYRVIPITANEKQKSYESIIPVIEQLIKEGFRKNNRLIAIGGGITQDITAFISSILYRGVHWFFYPTTLLAQGDSCIGSKTSINFGEYKNQVGGFYPPKGIFIYPGFLKTLSDKDLKSGIGEMCHYFIVAGENDFSYFKLNYQKALVDEDVLSNLISMSLKIKKAYIEIDEFDRKERQVFNYGHSFGHAIESLTNYAVPHGIAVCYGMDMANYISVQLGYITEDVRWHIRELLEQIWRDTPIPEMSLDRFISALRRDKKNVGSELRLILNKGIGNIQKVAMTVDDRFVGWIRHYFETQL